MRKCLVKVTLPKGAPIYYTCIQPSTADATIDAMDRFGHLAKISAKRLGA